MNKNFRNISGFTLIELLVVMSIIGILASVVLTSLNSSKERARDVIRAGDVASLSKATELYFAEHGYKFPNNASFYDDMKPYFSDTNGDGTGDPPVDPTLGYYGYAKTTGSPKGYCIGAAMEQETNGNGVMCVELGDYNYVIKGP